MVSQGGPPTAQARGPRPAAAASTHRSRGRPRLMSTEARRYLILDAALAVFAVDGPKGATIDEIARRAGVARAQIYEAFPSKDALFTAALERESQRITDHMRLVSRRAFELPIVERTRALYRAIYDYAELFPESLQLLTQVAYVPGADHQGRRTYRGLLAELLRDQLVELGWPARRLPDILATMFMALGEATSRRCFDEPGWNGDALVELLTHFTLGGLASVDRSILEAVDR
jgi:AcrR family transcriptional regulator